MEAKVPKGYLQVAQSDLTGTGGIRATAYTAIEDGDRKVFITVEDPVEDVVYSYGPASIRTITTLAHLLDDVKFLHKLR